MNEKIALFFSNKRYKLWYYSFLILLILNFFALSKDPLLNNLHWKTFFILISLGIIISIDNIPKKFLKPNPSKISFLIGISLLIVVFSNSLFDNFIYKNLDKIMTPVIVFSMCLINKPINSIFKFYKTFTISTIFFFAWFFYTPVTLILSPITTIFSWFFLNIFLDVKINLIDDSITIGKNIIEVLGACSGVNQLFFVLTILIVFLLEFNILRSKDILKIFITALLLPFFVNVFRIILLSLIVTSSLEEKQYWFNFFHYSYGSLFFSLITCTVFSKNYLSLVKDEINKIKNSNNNQTH